MARAFLLGGLRDRGRLDVTSNEKLKRGRVQVDAPPRPASFHDFLTSPNYQMLRARLIRIFARRGCPTPEDLADETIYRVALKLDKLVPSYEGDPARYFFAVARNVYLEYSREPKWTELDPDQSSPSEFSEWLSDEKLYDCLESCLSRLDDDEKSIITEYYRYDKIANINHRRVLAETYGIGLNALRIRVYRIRARLGRCVGACVEEPDAE